jgi:PhzF family phenazine biosynthesis protein
MRTTPCFHVAAFTTKAFAGNPAAVCLLANARPAKWRQAVAAELNLSETAFVEPLQRGFRLRWFTPTVEVDLCGHATLAAAHVLWTEGIAPAGAELRFATRSGELIARRRGARIELDFPVRAVGTCKAPAGLKKALGNDPVAVVMAGDDLLVELPDERAVRELTPDLAYVAALPVRGLIVTARGAGAKTTKKAKGRNATADFVSRFFGPAVGVPEDPVTGSAHCGLLPYWAERLGKTRLLGRQLSRRGGEVEVELDGGRALLRGAAVTTLRGQLLV